MATIALAPLQELGHILPTFQMAKSLRAAGHRVVYIGLEDNRAVVEAEGFPYVAIAGDLLGPGALARGWERARDHRLRVVVHAIEAEWRSLIGPALLLGHEDHALAAIGADVAIVDRDWEEMVLAFVGLGTRLVLHTVTLWGAFPPRLRDHVFDLDVPPLSSLAAPSSSALRSLVAWSVHDAGELVALGLREALVARLAARRRLSGRRDASWASVLGRRRALRRTLADDRAAPTLVLCPEELDFPRRHRRPGVEYCGPCIDETRREPALELALDPARPLVYCSVGSQGHRLGRRDPFVHAAVAAARGRAWQLVVAIGDAIDPATFEPLPDNVALVRRAPQLALLARAAAAIVHGGLGGIKECIWYEVPMLVLPGDHDQPGNAARVAHHGLGVARSRARISGGELGELVDGLVDDRDRRRRLAGFARQFQAREEERRHVAVVEAVLANHQRPGGSSPEAVRG